MRKMLLLFLFYREETEAGTLYNSPGHIGCCEAIIQTQVHLIFRALALPLWSMLPLIKSYLNVSH